MLRALFSAALLCGLVASLDTQQTLSGEASSVCEPCGAGRGMQACLPLSAPLVSRLLGDGLLSLAADGTVAGLAATACYLDHCTPTSVIDREHFCTSAAGRSSKRLGSSRRLLGGSWQPDSSSESRAPAAAPEQGHATAGWSISGPWRSGSSQPTLQPCAPPSVQYASGDGSLACCSFPGVVTYDALGAASCGPNKAGQAPASLPQNAAAAPTSGEAAVVQPTHLSEAGSGSSGFLTHKVDLPLSQQDEFVAQQRDVVANSLRTRWQETMSQMGANSGTANGAATASAPTGAQASNGRIPSLLQEDSSFKMDVDAQPNMLQYSGGYVDLAGTIGRIVPQVATARICADLCEQDDTCVAWKRKAGGSEDTLDCTLLTALDGPLLHAAGAGPPRKYRTPAKLQQRLPSMRYINPLASAELVESGTKAPDALPSALYGCPYPPVKGAEGDCMPPPSCNCVAGICYGSC